MILGVDPGRGKTGWALTDSAGGLALSGICPTPEFGRVVAVLSSPTRQWEEKLAAWTLERRASVTAVKCAALGDGTGSPQIALLLERLSVKTVLVDEEGTTLTARELYWRLHCPEWWRRLLPRSLWVPPRPVDDLAAWEIALRVLRGRKA
ncbi:MAG: endonuclease [Synergistaceae bacterium]|nr:endonuclease [Synergistaceae bacterium]